MTPDKLRNAIAEANRFVRTAKAALNTEESAFEGGEKWLQPGKQTGAARRASMDLTRALADMRRVS